MKRRAADTASLRRFATGAMCPARRGREFGHGRSHRQPLGACTGKGRRCLYRRHRWRGQYRLAACGADSAGDARSDPRLDSADSAHERGLYSIDGRKAVISSICRISPKPFRGPALGQAEALDYYRGHANGRVSWTYLSPPPVYFAPRSAHRQVSLRARPSVEDATGRSSLSYEDFAVATIDEVEQRKFINKRFTVGY